MTKAKWRKLFFRVSLAIIAAIVLFVVVFVGIVQLTPFDSSKLTRTSQPTVVYAGDGSVYMTISSSGAHDLTYDQMPANLRNAVVAVEDHNFWDGSSVDVKGMLRAAFVDLWSGSYAQGASTIQMQLAKIVYLNDKKTVGRKLSQMALGVQINRHFTKQEILAMYLNRVFLGENTVGVDEAAWRYYGIDISKHPEQLTLDKAALLAGLPQAPSAYDPIKHPDAALTRRNIVLEQMAKYGYITEAQAKQAEQKSIGHLTYHSLPGDAWDNHPLFTNFLFDYAQKEAGISPEELLQGGMKIYTTVDPKVQASVEKVFWSKNYNNDFPGPTSGTVVQGAALFVDPKTGGILGGAGSRQEGFVHQGYDRIYAKQSPGSSIKPVMEYGAAIESGKWGPDSILDNHVQTFPGGYTPRNDDPSAPGKMTLRQALATSQNVAAVWLLQQVGINYAADFAEKLGIPTTHNDRQHLGIAVGGLENGVNTLQMASAYSAFANKGEQMDSYLIKKIDNSSGDTIFHFTPGGQRVMSEQTAAVMTNLMQDVVSYGTGTPAQVPGWDVAGKTGTVQYDSTLAGGHQSWLRTGWFDGYTPSMVGSIYIAYDNTDEQHHLSQSPHFASWYAAKIFGDITQLAVAGETPQHFDTGLPAQTQQTPLTNLQAHWDSTVNALQLTWDSSMQGSVNFVVKRSDGVPADQSGQGQGNNGQNPTGNPDSYATLGQTDQTNFADSSVQPGMTYTYVVQAVDATTGQPLKPAQTLNVTIQGSIPGDQTGTGNGTTNNGTGNGTGDGSGDGSQPPGNTAGNTAGGGGNPGTGPGTGTGNPTGNSTGTTPGGNH